MMQATTVPARELFTSPDRARTGRRLGLLADVFDRFTLARLAEAGVREGARCLEVGAGGGSVAVWMAGQVGAAGRVVATDIDTSHIPEHPRLSVVTHNIRIDPLDELAGSGGFDVIHMRLVASFLSRRPELVARLGKALAPGGALVIEELDSGWNRYVVDTPDTEAYSLFADYHECMITALEAAGKDLNWEVYQAMHDAGLRAIDAQAWTKAWRGGQPGCLLLRDTITLPRLRDQLVEAGMAEDGLDRLAGLLTDPRLIAYMHPLVSTVARKPCVRPAQPAGPELAAADPPAGSVTRAAGHADRAAAGGRAAARSGTRQAAA